MKYCTFCGKSQDEVEKLVAGPNVFICNECVELCSEIIQEERVNAKEEIPTPLSAVTLESLIMEVESAVPGQQAAKQVLAMELLRRGNDARYGQLGQDRTILLAIGPTGCGKRRLVSRMVDVLALPQFWIDVPLLLPHASFKTVYQVKDFGEQPGVIVFNYLDALLTPGYSESSWQLQHALVSILDSLELRLGEAAAYRANTRQAVFVGICDLNVAPAPDPSRSPERLIEAGFIPALAARFTGIAPFVAPALSDYESMLVRPGGLLEECQTQLRRYGRTVRFDPDVAQAIAKLANGQQQGFFGLQAIMNRLCHCLILRMGDATKEEELNSKAIGEVFGVV